MQKGKHIHIYRENESSFNAQREKKTLRSGVASTKNLLVEARIWMNCNQLWWGTEIADYKER